MGEMHNEGFGAFPERFGCWGRFVVLTKYLKLLLKAQCFGLNWKHIDQDSIDRHVSFVEIRQITICRSLSLSIFTRSSHDAKLAERGSVLIATRIWKCWDELLSQVDTLRRREGDYQKLPTSPKVLLGAWPWSAEKTERKFDEIEHFLILTPNSKIPWRTSTHFHCLSFRLLDDSFVKHFLHRHGSLRSTSFNRPGRGGSRSVSDGRVFVRFPTHHDLESSQRDTKRRLTTCSWHGSNGKKI